MAETSHARRALADPHDGARCECGRDEREAERARLWAAYAARPESAVREQLIASYRPLVYTALRRMGWRGDEDLEQVAFVGLIEALDRFDPGSGYHFCTYAIPTVMGEIRRYLRDRSRPLRPPRSLLDLRAAIRAKESELALHAEVPPTVARLADALGVSPDEVVEAMAIEERCHPCSLDGLLPSVESDRPVPLEEYLGREDPEMAKVEERIALGQELQTLEPRLRRILELRYYRDLSQQEVARRLGISQMHVSRLERRALERLRGHMLAV